MFLVLIGPRGAGKSTVGKELAKQRGCRYVSLDDEIAHHLKDFGGLFGYARWREKYIRKEFPGLTDQEYIKRSWHDAYSVFHEILPVLIARLGKSETVLDIGGGILADEHHRREKSQALIKSLGTTVLLIPDGNEEEVKQILFERERQRKMWHDRSDESLKAQIAAEWNTRIPQFQKIADATILAQGSVTTVSQAIETCIANLPLTSQLTQ